MACTLVVVSRGVDIWIEWNLPELSDKITAFFITGVIALAVDNIENTRLGLLCALTSYVLIYYHSIEIEDSTLEAGHAAVISSIIFLGDYTNVISVLVHSVLYAWSQDILFLVVALLCGLKGLYNNHSPVLRKAIRKYGIMQVRTCLISSMYGLFVVLDSNTHDKILLAQHISVLVSFIVFWLPVFEKSWMYALSIGAALFDVGLIISCRNTWDTFSIGRTTTALLLALDITVQMITREVDTQFVIMLPGHATRNIKQTVCLIAALSFITCRSMDIYLFSTTFNMILARCLHELIFPMLLMQSTFLYRDALTWWTSWPVLITASLHATPWWTLGFSAFSATVFLVLNEWSWSVRIPFQSPPDFRVLQDAK